MWYRWLLLLADMLQQLPRVVLQPFTQTNTCNTNNQPLNCQLKHFKYTIHNDHDGLTATSKANKILQQTALDQYAWNASDVAQLMVPSYDYKMFFKDSGNMVSSGTSNGGLLPGKRPAWPSRKCMDRSKCTRNTSAYFVRLFQFLALLYKCWKWFRRHTRHIVTATP